MITAHVELVAQYYDVDPMNIVWHGNYTRFLEQARAALLDRIGYGYAEMERSGFGWPIVDLRMRYLRPIRLGQRFRVEAELVEYENRIRIDYRCRDAASGETLNRAQTTQVAVSVATGEPQLVSPPVLVEKVRRLL
jgi:acyl-CoA thioester hydrolase